MISSQKTDIYIVTEFMENGSLKELLDKGGPLEWKLLLRMAKDIAQVR